MQKVSKYSLRKKTIGLASVMVGSVFGVSVNADADVNNDVREKAESTKHGKLIINYYIEGTTTKLADSFNADRPVGEKYSEDVPSIRPKNVREDVPGDTTKFKYITTNYELVSKPVNANGVITEGETVVNYYYRPVITENIYNKGGDIVIYHTDSSFDVQHVFDEELEKDVRGFDSNNSLFLNYKYGTKTSVFRGVYDAVIGMKDNGNPDIPSKEYAIEEQTKFVKMLGYDSIDNYNRIHKESSGNGDKPLTLGDVGVAHTWQRTGTTIPGPVTSSYYNISSDIVDFDTRGHLGADLDVFEGKDTAGLNQYDSMIPSGAELEVTKLTYNIDGGEEKVAPTKGYTYSRDNGTMVKGKTTHFTYHYKLKKREVVKDEQAISGSVVVKYVDTDGNEIKPQVDVLKNASAGKKVTKDIISGTYKLRTVTDVSGTPVNYNTENLKEQTIQKNGKTYVLTRVLPKGTKFNNTEATSGTVKEGVTTVVYEYREVQKGNLIVNHYKEGTTDKLSNGSTAEMNVGDKYTTSSLTITPKVETQDLPDRTIKRTTTYELVKTPDNANGTIAAGDNVVNYYYREIVKEDVTMKRTKDVVEYHSESGYDVQHVFDSELEKDVSGFAGANSIFLNQKYGTKTQVKRTVYDATIGFDDKPGGYPSDDKIREAEERFVRMIGYTSLSQFNSSSDHKPLKLGEQAVYMHSHLGNTISPDLITGAGYYGTIGDTATFRTRYEDDLDVFENKDESMLNVYDSMLPSGAELELTKLTYNIDGGEEKLAPTTGYTYSRDNGTMVKDKTTHFTYHYKLKKHEEKSDEAIKGSVVVKYVDTDGNEIKDAVQLVTDADAGKKVTTKLMSGTYEISSKTNAVEGSTKYDAESKKEQRIEKNGKVYTLKRVLPKGTKFNNTEATSGVVTEGVTTVVYEYELVEKDGVIANHYKEGTTEKLADSVVQNELVIGTDYKTESKTIAPKVTVEELPDRTVKRTVTYTLVKEPENKTGKVIKGGTTVNYYYKEVIKEDVTMKKDGVVANYYKEGTTEKLADSVVETDKVIGTDYVTKAKVIEPKVSVEDLEDKTIKRMVTYELVGTPQNATGKIVKGGVVVNYYYRENVKEEVTPKHSNIVINHYKYGTTEKIGDTETRTNVPIGSSYTTDPKVIPPKVVVEEFPNRTVKRTITYVPVEPANKNGKVTKGGVVVNYYYKEVVKEDITKKEEPAKPTEPTKPVEPKAPVKPGTVKPTEPKKPVEPAKLVTKEPVKPTEPGKFTLEKPVKPTEPVKPRKPIVDPNDGDLAETQKPIAPVKPVEPTKPTMEQPVEPVNPGIEKPTEPVRPTMEKPVEPVKPKEEPKAEPKVEEPKPKVEPKVETKKKLPETGDTANLAVMGLGALIAARRLRRKEQ